MFGATTEQRLHYVDVRVCKQEAEYTVVEPRMVVLEHDAVLALTQILGIMLDFLSEADSRSPWNPEHIIELDERLTTPAPGEALLLGIDDAELLLQGMAFTEVMSADLPWVETVRWVTDFVTAELRQHWTDEEWREFSLMAR